MNGLWLKLPGVATDETLPILGEWRVPVYKSGDGSGIATMTITVAENTTMYMSGGTLQNATGNNPDPSRFPLQTGQNVIKIQCTADEGLIRFENKALITSFNDFWKVESSDATLKNSPTAEIVLDDLPRDCVVYRFNDCKILGNIETLESLTKATTIILGWQRASNGGAWWEFSRYWRESRMEGTLRRLPATTKQFTLATYGDVTVDLTQIDLGQIEYFNLTAVNLTGETANNSLKVTGTASVKRENNTIGITINVYQNGKDSSTFDLASVGRLRNGTGTTINITASRVSGSWTTVPTALATFNIPFVTNAVPYPGSLSLPSSLRTVDFSKSPMSTADMDRLLNSLASSYTSGSVNIKMKAGIRSAASDAAVATLESHGTVVFI